MKKVTTLALVLLLAVLLPVIALADLLVSFIDVGQGDATLIQCDGQNMLIDSGTNASTEALLSYLSEKAVSSFDLVVGTHPHEDHIGGLDNVIEQYDVENIWMPRVQADTKTFEDVLLAVRDKGLRITAPSPGQSFALGGSTITVLGPVGSGYEDTNNYSIVLRIDYGDYSFLFTGDAERESEQELLASGANLKADVLKVGHHGSSSSTTKAFLNAVDPDFAVISSGEGNSYGHPTSEVLDTLQTASVSVFRTDKCGTISISSNSNNLLIDYASRHSNDAEATSDSGYSMTITYTATEEDIALYIGNKNSHKFHDPSCGSLPLEKNRTYFKNREEAVDAGYDPCKKCKP